MEEYRPFFVAVTFGLLGLAFYLTYRPGRTAGGGRVAMFNKIMLWSVAAIAAVLLFFPQASTFFESGSKVTADMQRTVIQVEGMT